MLAITEFDTTADPTRLDASSPVALAPQLHAAQSPSGSASRPQVARPAVRPPVLEDDFDSLWDDEPVCSW